MAIAPIDDILFVVVEIQQQSSLGFEGFDP